MEHTTNKVLFTSDLLAYRAMERRGIEGIGIMALVHAVPPVNSATLALSIWLLEEMRSLYWVFLNPQMVE